MASNNDLLGSGKPREEVTSIKTTIIQKKTPALLYSTDFPNGKVIYTDQEYDKLIEAGWKDHPGKVSRLPGFEKMYDDEQVTMSQNDISGNNEKPKTIFEE